MEAPRYVEVRVPNPPSLVSLIESAKLPTIPVVAVEIVGLMQRPDLDIDMLSETISRDPALAARVLKTANSGFYGRPRSVSKVRDAVMVLGLRSVKTLALGFSLVGGIQKNKGGMDQGAIWQRSLLTATAARTIAARARLQCADEAFLAGLLHLIGVVGLGQALGDDYRRLTEQSDGDLARLRALERARYGFDHAEAGAALAESWKLPELLVSAIRLFPRPDSAQAAERELVRCVATAEAAADLALGVDPAGAITRFRWDCEQLFGLSQDEADTLIAVFMQDAVMLGAMLDIREVGLTAEEVLERAREALLQLTLEAERENTQLQAERERLAVEASTDALTGLSNRRHLEEYLGEQFRISTRYGTPLSVLMIDIDHFKGVNDEHGHGVGDQVLREVALTLRETMREADLCARYGGEEFVVVAPATPADGAVDVAERIRAAIERRIMFASAGQTLRVTVSVGVSSYRPGDQPSADWLVKEADMALYEAKRAGRNVVRAFEAMEPASPWDAPLEAPRRAIG